MSNTMYGHGPTRCASSHTMPSLDGEIDREYFIQCWQAREIGTSVGCRILVHILEEHEARLLSVVSQHNVTKLKTDVRYDEVLRRTFSRRWFYFSIQYLLGLLWHFQCLFLSRIVVLSICVRRYTLFFSLVYALQIRGSCNIRLAMETVASKHFAHSPASELWATLGKQPTVFSFPSKHNTGVFQNIFFSAKRPTDYGGGRRHTIL